MAQRFPRRRMLIATALLSTLPIGALAQPLYPHYPPPAPPPGAIVGGILGVMGQMARQAQQQQQQQQQMQQQQQQMQLQQQQAIQRQQQIEADRQRALAAAQEEAGRQQAQLRQRQQTEADARLRQQQAAAKAANEAKASAEAEARRQAEAVGKLRSDPVFAGVLGADGQDIAAMIVATDTPSVMRNLKGEPVFQKGADACLPFGTDTIDPQFLSDVKQRIEEKGGVTGASLLLTSCEPGNLANHDVIIFSGAQIAGGPLEVLSPLVDALRNRQFVALETFRIADFRAAEAAHADAVRRETMRQEATRLDALKSFQSRDPAVISVIRTETPASVVCIATSPDPDGVRYLLKRAGSPFSASITPASVLREQPSTDAIFIAFKRKECTAAAAPAGMLRDVMAGLVRDGFKVEVDSGTISADQLAGWKLLSAQELADAQKQQAESVVRQRQAQTQQDVEEQERRVLQAQRQANDEGARREQLERMRKLAVSKATAVMDEFMRRAQRHIASVVAQVKETQLRARTGRVLTRQELADQQQRYAADQLEFQPWAAQVETLVKEGWEFSDPKATIEDYGRAQWKQRTIEAITVRVEFPIVNKLIGERKTVCNDFTWINDEEFQFMRQLLSVPCEDYDRRFAEWAQANGFVSQWKLLEPTEPSSSLLEDRGRSGGTALTAARGPG
jgi:multidrug efflux pump subunit AcrA (membrane-fusion protein)